MSSNMSNISKCSPDGPAMQVLHSRCPDDGGGRETVGETHWQEYRTPPEGPAFSAPAPDSVPIPSMSTSFEDGPAVQLRGGPDVSVELGPEERSHGHRGIKDRDHGLVEMMRGRQIRRATSTHRSIPVEIHPRHWYRCGKKLEKVTFGRISYWHQIVRRYLKTHGEGDPPEIAYTDPSRRPPFIGHGICANWHQKGRCRKGKSCRFLHAQDPRTIKMILANRTCSRWKSNTCIYGDDCIFRHAHSPRASSS